MNPELISEIRSGSAIDAFEAAKALIDKPLSRSRIRELASVARSGIETHNKEAATYALSLIKNKNAALDILIDLLDATNNDVSVRGRAAEGIGLVNPTRRNKLRMKTEETLINCLRDTSATVRFWSCYAVGNMKVKRAVPILEKLMADDKEICPGWWYVSEEAEDAIEWINGRQGKDRMPVQER